MLILFSKDFYSINNENFLIKTYRIYFLIFKDKCVRMELALYVINAFDLKIFNYATKFKKNFKSVKSLQLNQLFIFFRF